MGKFLAPVSLLRNPRLSSPHNFIYSFDGDANGVLFFAGQNYNTAGIWTNPHTAGRCVCQASDTSGGGSGAVARMVDRDGPDGNDFGTGNIPNSWYTIDLKSGHGLIVNNWTARCRPFDGTRALRTFRLQGSNDAASNSVIDLDAATWDNIDVRSGDTTMPTVANAFATYTPNQGNTNSYRWIKLLQDGTNALGDNYLLIAELEFYGAFTF